MMNLFSFVRVSAATAGTNASPAPMTLEQVVNNLMSRNEERARSLKSYEGDRTYTVRYHGFPK
ncbi:MAG TPA: hypothetical protein VFN62_07585, partial [Acidobacteriaceae bacterium]|nr:hypothetical protein [Acidobacteriaceae bacterium]